MENQQLADDLNVFNYRFEKARLTPSSRSDLHFTHSPTLHPYNPIPPSPTTQPVLKVCVEDVNRVFRKQKSRKASGPDGISPACLNVCADQLAPIFTQIFNRSVELLNCCPLASATEHWAPKHSDTKTVFTPSPYHTWKTHNTPQYCTSVNNSLNLHLYIGHYCLFSSLLVFFYYLNYMLSALCLYILYWKLLTPRQIPCVCKHT